MHNQLCLTPKNNSENTTKIPFKKSKEILDIYSAKETKKFEFPNFLNNYTCEEKKNSEISFNFELYNQKYLKEKLQKCSSQNFAIISNTNRLEKPKIDPKDLKIDDISPMKLAKEMIKYQNISRYSASSLNAKGINDLLISKTPKTLQPFGDITYKANVDNLITTQIANMRRTDDLQFENLRQFDNTENKYPNQMNSKEKPEHYAKDRIQANFLADKENNILNSAAYNYNYDYEKNQNQNHATVSNNNMPSNNMPSNNMPSNNMPSNNMPINNIKKSPLYHDSQNKDHKKDSSQSNINFREVTILDQDPEERELKQGKFREDYKVYQQIGQGAYASVRLALYKPENKKVAIKIYEKSKIMDPMRRKSVKREIKLMQKMDHPNIIKIYDTFETNNHVNIIMEYVGGSSLHSYLKAQPNRRLKEENAYKLFKQVATGISYCHSRCITHRDIKLENLLMDENNILKIIDFGFSTCIPNDKKVKMFCGTPSYMAPEIVLKKEYCGPPADIWALGVLLYALLCGTFPFKGATDKELYKKIVKGEFLLVEGVSDAASALIRRMINIDSEKRPTSKEVIHYYLFLFIQTYSYLMIFG